MNDIIARRNSFLKLEEIRMKGKKRERTKKFISDLAIFNLIESYQKKKINNNNEIISFLVLTAHIIFFRMRIYFELTS